MTYQLELERKDKQAQKQEIETNLKIQETKLAKIMSERKFKLRPEQLTPILSLKLNNKNPKKIFQCKMKQIPANSNNATKVTNYKGCQKIF